MNKKILVLGVNGMAGHIITTGLREDSEKFEVIGVARSNSIIKPNLLFDILDFCELERVIKKVTPDIIINCVGLLNKNAEENPDKAILINSYLPHFLETLTKFSKTRIIHISTDCVFSGKEGNYTENSFKNGIGYYAQSKALGEVINTKDLTFRTSIIGPEINTEGIGLFHWFYNQTDNIKGFTNAFWTGITTIELLNAIKSAINENLIGLYHLVNCKKISKYELLNLMNVEFERNIIIIPEEKYKIDKSLLNTRDDFSFNVKEYKEMLKEMNFWIQSHKTFYSHYDTIFIK
jgi:dTDP-4-dehydrorhamnose reductase